MTTSQNASITSYFHKSDPPLRRKRPCSEYHSEEPRDSTRRGPPLKSLNHDQRSQQNHEAPQSSRQLSGRCPPDDQQISSSQLLPSSQQTLPSRTVPAPDSDNDIAQEESSSQQQDSEFSLATREPELPNPLSAIVGSAVRWDQDDKTPKPAGSDYASRYQTLISSQPTLTSSQRIIRDGETMIRNSDDESDASLEDIDDLLDNGRPSGRSFSQSNPQLPSPDDEMSRKLKRTTRGAARAAKSSWPLPSLPSLTPRKHKFSLEALIKQKKQDEASGNEIARAHSMLQSYDEYRASADPKKEILETDFIDSILKDHGDEDDIGRLKSAILRTEAMQHGKSWSFFDDKPMNASSQDSNFSTIQDEQLQKLCGKEVYRQRAFLSGYMGEYAMKRDLPKDVLFWIMDAVCKEPREDLRYSYSCTMKHAAEQLAPLLTPEYIKTLFEKLGATTTALNLEKPVEPYRTLSRHLKPTVRPGLLSLLAILGTVAEHFVAESRIHLLGMLCRLALDHTLVKSCHAVSVLEEAFENLIETMPEECFEYEVQTVMASVCRTVSDASLQLQLLQVMPSWSRRLALFRRRLALAFFLQDSSYLAIPAEDRIDLKTITRSLQRPQFTITNATDFSDLAASINILNIAVDSGDPPPSSPFSKEAESAFNEDIDIIASRLNSMFNDIVDTGASHMKRTETKEVLEGLQRRLEYGVRTKPKPKKLIFGDAAIVPLQEKMKAFIDSGNPSDLPALMTGR